MNVIKVSVPATAANLGPGFDAIGLALGLRNSVVMYQTPAGLNVEVSGEGAEQLPRNSENEVVQAAYRVFERVIKRPQGLTLNTVNRIPPGSGLGSSAAARVAGLVAANALLDFPLEEPEIASMAGRLEGHADNALPALLGGLVAGFTDQGRLIYRRIETPEFRVVIALPALQLSTGAMRAALPQQVSLGDAVANISRALLVVEALRCSDYDLLAHAIQDRLHVPHRRRFIPGYEAAEAAGLRAGAAAVTISGSGPALIAFAPAGHEQIAAAMVAAINGAGAGPARSWTLPVDFEGARLEV